MADARERLNAALAGAPKATRVEKKAAPPKKASKPPIIAEAKLIAAASQMLGNRAPHSIFNIGVGIIKMVATTSTPR